MTKSYQHHEADSCINDFGVPQTLHYRDCELLSDSEYFDLLDWQSKTNLY